ncbi:MAG: carboxypeptidase regulatory-like domain-containing protein [Desulfococcaceae bacterium]
MNSKCHKTAWVMLWVLFSVLPAARAFAGPKLESVSKTLGVVGTDLPVVLTGTEFNATTKVSIFPDVGNIRRIIGSYYTPGYATDVEISGNMAYVTDSSGRLQIIDVSNPSNPMLMGEVKTQGTASGIALSGSMVYLIDEVGLKIINVSNPYSPVVTGGMDMAYAGGIAVYGSIIYIVDNDSLLIINVSDPANPKLIGSLGYEDSDLFSVAVKNTTVYIAGIYFGGRRTYPVFNDLYVVNVQDPANPAIIGSVNETCVTTNKCLPRITVEGTKAHVTCGGSLQIIDVSNPTTPEIMGSEDTLTYCVSGVTVEGTTAYVADAKGLQIINVAVPTAPTIIGSVDMPGANDVTVSGNIAYVATDAGLKITDVSNPSLTIAQPVQITPVVLNSSTSLSLTVPGPAIAASYTLRVSDSSTSHDLPGAVTFVPPDSDSLSAKAIIVAGKGTGTDSVWTETRMVADYAYKMLKIQGYTDDRIRYLTPETYVSGVSILPPTQTNLQNSITQWAADASGLLLYFVGHGGDGYFSISPTETLEAEVLNTWLDELQNTITGPVIFIYDACASGSFLAPLTASYPLNRIVITSGADEFSWLIEDGYKSFSYKFWSFISNNANLNEAFFRAHNEMKVYQTANLDANGNGKSDEPDDKTLAGEIEIGSGRIVDTQVLKINRVSVEILNGTPSGHIKVSGTWEPLERIWAEIIPPDDTSKTDIREQDIVFNNNDIYPAYEGNYTDFTKQGTYTVTIYAKNADTTFSSVPTGVTQTAGTVTSVPDSYEEDDTFAQAKIISINDDVTQKHSFHDAGDTDMVKFYGLAGQTYTIRAIRLSAVCNVFLQLYNSDKTGILAYADSRSEGGDESMGWTCTTNGIYYVKAGNADPGIFGETVTYELEIYKPSLSDEGDIHGEIRDPFGNPITGVRISTNGAGSALSEKDGTYDIYDHQSGNFLITAQADAYQDKTGIAVTVVKAGSHTVNITMSFVPVIPGDIDNSTHVDLADAVLALQISAGKTEFEKILHKQADINNDTHLGPAEAVYALRKAAGL